jgi:hypothetical protein
MHECYTERIAPVVLEKWEERRELNPGVLSKEPKAGFRVEVAHAVFAALPSAERAEFANRAKEDAVRAKANYLAALKSPPSKAPQDRQK